MIQGRRYTIAEVAEVLEVERDEARGLVQFLLAIDCATKVGERSPASGRGSKEHIYVFDDAVAVDTCKVLSKL